MRLPMLVLVLGSTLPLRAAGHVSLPPPAGPLPVGRIELLWSDPSRLEDVGPTAGKPREVLTYVYYPAIPRGNKAKYFPGLKDLEGANEARLLRRQFGTQWHAVASGTLLSNAYDGAPLSVENRKFPVLIFSPGEVAPVLSYQAQLQEFASRGYVVFGLEHGTDSALLIRPDHTLLPYVSRRAPDQGPPTVDGLKANRDSVIRRTADIRFAIDQIERVAKSGNSIFQDRLDLARIGAFGHSMGGKAAIRACQTDRRLRACANQDGEMFGDPLHFFDSNPFFGARSIH